MASSLLKGLSDTGVCFGEQPDVFLSETDILCLLDDLVEVSPKWEELGIALRLPGYVISQCKDDDNSTKFFINGFMVAIRVHSLQLWKILNKD